MAVIEKRGDQWWAKCPDCPPEKAWRKIKPNQASNLRLAKYSGRCKPCSQKEILVEVSCPSCGNPRHVKASTARHYKRHSSVPVCPECSLMSLPRGALKGCGTMHNQHRLVGPTPVIPAPTSHRCHGLWDGCPRYDRCLDWAEATGMRGWVCAWDHGTRYHEFVQADQIREAFEHAVVYGLGVESMESTYACSLTRTGNAL